MFCCLSGAVKRSAAVASAANTAAAADANAARRRREERELFRVLRRLPRATLSETVSRIRAISEACSAVGLVVDVQALVIAPVLPPEHRFGACEQS